MTFIKTIPARKATGAVRDMYERQQEHWGYVPNYAKAFSHRPEVMARWGRLLAEIRRPADDRLFELITFVVAIALRHSACSLAHGSALAKMIGADSVIAIAEGGTPDVLSEAEIAAMAFARDIARDASRITAGQIDALKLRYGYSDAEIFDIAAIAAGRCFFTKLLDALGSEPDVSFMEIEQPLREKLTGRRPISHSKPEHVAA